MTTVGRLIFNLKRSDHITNAFILACIYVSLHWLRIRYKVAVLTYKVPYVLHGSPPLCLGPLVHVADVPGRHALCSAGTNRLIGGAICQAFHGW
jgi:hypothetical protein